jgi:uncharacterized iron-regulated membrane protein
MTAVWIILGCALILVLLVGFVMWGLGDRTKNDPH